MAGDTGGRREEWMKYAIGRQGRIIIARFDDGDNVLGGIEKIARDEEIRAAFFIMLGGMKRGRFVAGPEDETMPPVPIWRELSENNEVFGTGTIFWEGDVPRIHFHGAYARGDSVKAGCMREGSETFLITEVIITEIEGVNAERVRDASTGLPLLDIRQG